MLERIVSTVNDIVWSPALVILLIAAGLYFTVRTRFVQIRRLKLMVKLLFSRSPKAKGVSSFQAFCMALSGRVGTGNIVGVATAIAMGGPGAIFWMWVIAFFGASTAFVESTLAQIYKFPHHTGWRGGPTTYIDNGLKQRWLGILFAVFTIIGYGLLSVTVQANGAASPPTTLSIFRLSSAVSSSPHCCCWSWRAVSSALPTWRPSLRRLWPSSISSSRWLSSD